MRFDVAHGGERARGQGRWKGMAEGLRPGALREIVGKRLRTGGESARRPAECFPERRGDDVDVAEHVVVLRGAATLRAEDAGRVRVIDGEHRVVLAGERRQIWPPGDVA